MWVCTVINAGVACGCCGKIVGHWWGGAKARAVMGVVMGVLVAGGREVCGRWQIPMRKMRC